MSHLSRADADKLMDLIHECRTTAREDARTGVRGSEEAWRAAVYADDAAFKAVSGFVRSLECES